MIAPRIVSGLGLEFSVEARQAIRNHCGAYDSLTTLASGMRAALFNSEQDSYVAPASNKKAAPWRGFSRQRC
jgi:hypothetical protein